MNTFKTTLCALAMTFSLSGHAKKCPTTPESQKDMKAYLVTDVQKSLEIADFILKNIQEIKASPSNDAVSFSGNAYILTISKKVVEIETEYADPADPRAIDGVLKTTHSLCEFEAKLVEYIEILKREQN